MKFTVMRKSCLKTERFHFIVTCLFQHSWHLLMAHNIAYLIEAVQYSLGMSISDLAATK